MNTPKVHILHLIRNVYAPFDPGNVDGFRREYWGHTLILGIKTDEEYKKMYEEYFDCFNAEGFEVLHAECEEDAIDYDCDLEHMQLVEDIDEDNPFLLDDDDMHETWRILNHCKYGQRMTFMESVAAMWDAYDGVNLSHVRGCNI